MDLSLLGELRLRVDGRSRAVGTPRQQAVLAALALDANRPVSAQRLIERLWGDSAPNEARSVLYSHLSRIRGALNGGPGRIERRHAGYVLVLEPELVDVHRFQRLVRRGRDEGRSDEARAADLAAALRLWRGTPLAGIGGDWVEQVRDWLGRQRVDAVAGWAEVELRCGRPEPVIAALPELIAEYPLAEPLEVLLMRALSATGRDAEALDRFGAARRRLAELLGTDPGPELRAAHQAVLGRDRAAPSHHGPRAVPPAQLPPDLPGFAGREDELRRLDDLLTGPGAIVTITGTAGVGKTALALHWAHRAVGRFRDGQLYVNLRGFDPAGAPVPPQDAVRAFLDAFDVPTHRIPTGLDAQVGLYRSLVAGRRVLVVLDNARDAEQVRPLLPGASGCVTVVTSRDQLTGLVVAAGATLLTLERPDPGQARDLLTRRLGADRVAAEPAAVDEIVAACARLPLALAVVAARAAAHPDFRLTDLAAELRDAHGRLDVLASDDLAIDLRAVFSWSYQQLNPQARRLFRLLGTAPGPDISLAAAASLAGATSGHVRQVLAELAHAHLVTEHRSGRYSFHDLLRAYAAEPDDTGSAGVHTDRRAALHRVLDHYLHVAHAAAMLVNPQRDPIPLSTAGDGVIADDPVSREQAMAWFGAEHSVLLAAIGQAASSAELDAYAWPLAWTLQDYLDRHGRWSDQLTAQQAALRAADRRADRLAQAHIHRAIAGALTSLGRHDQARSHYQHALTRFAELGESVGLANTHLNLGNLLDQLGHPDQAMHHADQALSLYCEADHEAGQANALNAIGWCHTRLGDHHQALASCQKALSLQQQIGELWGQAYTWDSLGNAYRQLSDHVQAVYSYRQAVALQGQLGNRYYEALARNSLGDVQHAIGDTEAARQEWQLALDTLRDLGRAGADDIQDKLRRTQPAP